MAVVCSSLILCFPGMLLGYCLRDFEMIPVALIITGVTFALTFHMRRIYYEDFILLLLLLLILILILLLAFALLSLHSNK